MRERDALQSILTKALLEARQSNKPVKRIRIALGQISELDPAFIESYWSENSQGTLAERAHLEFRFINAEVQCMACFQKYHPMDRKIHCPYCGSYGAKILSGEEMYLESIELDDEQA